MSSDPQMPHKRSGKPVRRVFPSSEGEYSRRPSEYAQKSLIQQLHEIKWQERAEARERQRKAGIKEPARTDFSRDLDPERDAAMETIWQAGPQARCLYTKISKGLASLSWADVFALARCKPAEIEAVAPALTQGLSLKQASEQTEES